MAVISSVLAIIGLIILTVAVFALIGAGSTASALGLGEGLTSILTGIGSVIASYWEVFAALFTIGLIAYVSRGSGGKRNGSAVDTAIGAAEGATKALADDDDSGTDPTPEPTPDPEPDNPDPETSTPTGGDDGGGAGDTDISVTQMQQQQQQMMQQLVQAIVMGNMSQNPSGTYIMQQQQQQMMGAGLFSGISPSVYRTFINSIDNSSNEQIINQFLEFIQVNDIDEVNDRVIVQFMKQVLNINVDLDVGGTGNGDVIVQINQIIQHIDITMIEQNIEKIVSELDITNNQFILVEQLIAILFSLEEGDYTSEGDTIIIDTTGLNIDIDITVQIEASVLINFLTIMKVIKYWELKKLLVELVEMPPEKSWNVKIEQLIVIYRESNGGDNQGPNIDLSGSNWEVFLRTVRQQKFDANLKNGIIDTLEDNINWNQQYGVTTATFSSIKNAINSLPKEDVPKAGQKLVEILKQNNSISNEVLRQFIEYIYNKWPANRTYLKNEQYYRGMGQDEWTAAAEQRLQEIIGEIEEEEQIEKKSIELHEGAKQDLKKALTDFKEEEDFIHAVRTISTDLENNSIGSIAEEINEVNRQLGIDLTDSNYAGNQEDKMREIARLLEDAVEKLKNADHQLETVEQEDIEIEETLQQVEQNEINMAKSAETVLRKIHN